MAEVESVSIQWRGGRGEDKVEVAGQFSNWQPLSLARQEEGDSWGIRLKLRHGEYQMKFIVDGEWRFSGDLDTVADIDGNINNLLVVEPVTNVDEEEAEKLSMVSVAEPVTSVDDEETEKLTPEIEKEPVVGLEEPVTRVDDDENNEKLSAREIMETAEVTLKWTGSSRQVFVAGDFSNWEALTMSQTEKDLWKIHLKVKQGSHLLKFFVDEVEAISDDMEKHIGPDGEVFNILTVSDQQRSEAGPSNEVEPQSSFSPADNSSHPTDRMECSGFNVGDVSEPEAGTRLEIADSIDDSKCQNRMSGGDRNVEEFARADPDTIDDVEIGGNAGVSVRNVHWKGFARDVRVIGDFSNWTPLSLSNQGSDDWSLRLKLPQGPHLIKFIVDKNFVLSEELEKVIGPDQELYNLVQVGGNEGSRHEIKYESDSEPTSMVVIDSEENDQSAFNSFAESFDETGHWVETGYNHFAAITPDDLSIIYEEETSGNSHVELIDGNHKETVDASDSDKAAATLINERQIFVNDPSKIELTERKKFSDDSLSPYCGGKAKNVTEVVDTCIKWIGFARHVQVIGDFSNWVPLILSNEKDDDWQLVVKIPFGCYLMKYIVDGRYVITDHLERRRGPDGEIYNLLTVSEEQGEEEEEVEIMRTKSSPVESFTADSLQDSGYDQSFEEIKQFSSSSSTNDDYEKESQILGSLTPEIGQEGLVDTADIPLIRTDSDQLAVFLGCDGVKAEAPPAPPALQVPSIPIIRCEEEQLAVFHGASKGQASTAEEVEEDIRDLVRQITEAATQELCKENQPDGETGENQPEIKSEQSDKEETTAVVMESSGQAPGEQAEQNDEKLVREEVNKPEYVREDSEESDEKNKVNILESLEKNDDKNGIEENVEEKISAIKEAETETMKEKKEIEDDGFKMSTCGDALDGNTDKTIETKIRDEKSPIEGQVQVLDYEESEKTTSPPQIETFQEFLPTKEQDFCSNQQIQVDCQDKHSENKEDGNSKDECFDKVADEKSSPNESDVKIENCITQDEKVFKVPESRVEVMEQIEVPRKIEDVKEATDNMQDVQEMIELPDKIEEIKDVIEVPNKLEGEKDVQEMIEVTDKIEEFQDVIEVPNKIEEGNEDYEKIVIEDPKKIEGEKEVSEKTEEVKEVLDKIVDVKDVIEVPNKIEDVNEVSEKIEDIKDEIEVPNKIEDVKEVLEKIEAVKEVSEKKEDVTEVSEKKEDIKEVSEKTEDVKEVSEKTEDVKEVSEKIEDVKKIFEVPNEIEEVKDVIEDSTLKEEVKEIIEDPTKFDEVKEVVDKIDHIKGVIVVPNKIDDEKKVSEKIDDFKEEMEIPEKKEDVKSVIENFKEVMEVSNKLEDVKEENQSFITESQEAKEKDEPLTSGVEKQCDKIIEEHGDHVTLKETSEKGEDIKESTETIDEKELVKDCIEDAHINTIRIPQNIESTETPKELANENSKEAEMEIFEKKKVVDKDEKDIEALDKLKSEEQAIIDDMNIQNFIDKNNELLYQGNGNVNDAFVNCDDENIKETPEIKDNHEKDPVNGKKETQENETIRSAINAAEANVAKFEEALKIHETNESVEGSDDSSVEGKSKPFMKSICAQCTVM